MYNDLKKHWDNQFRLSANKVFADFLYNLERGGAQAKEFIENNPDLAETVLSGPEAVEAILKAIAGDKEAAENQAYFFSVANGMLARVRTLLARKYEASVRYCEQEGIPVEDFTAETLLPGVRKADENGGFDESDETDPPAESDPDNESADVDNSQEVAEEAKNAEQVQEEIAQANAEAEATTDAEAEHTASDEEAPETEASAEETPADAVEKAVPFTEDDLKAKINLLVGDGASKSDVWQEVAEEAKTIGWNSKSVWAYIDEITSKQ